MMRDNHRLRKLAKLGLVLSVVALALLLVMAAAGPANADPGGPQGNDSGSAAGNGNGNGKGPGPGKGNKGQHHAVQLGPVDAAATSVLPQHAPTKAGPRPNAPRVPFDQTQLMPDGSVKPSVAAATLPSGASINLKLLVISADGNETDFPAIQAFLKQIGIPFDTLIATKAPLTAGMLSDGGAKAYYQGIILCTGNLTYYNGTAGQWQSAFTSDQWTTLWQYEAKFGIRQVTSYTFPYGYPDNYGLSLVTYQDTTTAPLQATLTAAGRQVFPYLNAANPITIRNAWTYLAMVCVGPICGCTSSCPTVTPLLTTASGYVIASVANYPDGRQNLTVTAANNPDLFHSLLLSYGITNWVTKGYFLGERHVNLDVQPDDILTEDDIWDTKALTDTTGLTYRMTGADLQAMLNWQNGMQARPTTTGFKIEWPFNGEGGTDVYDVDDLTPAVIANQASFNWISHTFTHLNLDPPTTAAQTQNELKQNDDFAVQQTKVKANSNYFKDSLVQPDISGLSAPNALQAMKNFGIKYVIADTSQRGWNNPSPNTGFYSTYQPSILIIPRRPTNLFYNLVTPAQWVSEYNCYYGPTGTCAGGRWRYWNHNLTYAEILDKESDIWLRYLLKWDLDPLMFHQPNGGAYDGVHSLLSDLIDATLAKYNAMYNLPIRNQMQHEAGARMANRMAYNASGVRATLVVGTGVTLTTTKAATIPVTGIAYGANTETYGGQTISYVTLAAGQTVTLRSP